MFVHDTSPQAYWLTLGMARVAGANLPAAVVEGWMRREELGRLVDRCGTCGRDDACMSWLARAPVPAPHLPAYCPNAPEIEALSPALR
ncbi:MAG: DUF6455 family protein [Gemmobacter sp.]